MAPNPFAIAQEVVQAHGYHHEVLNDHIWKFLFTGKNLPEIDVITIWRGHLLIMGTVIIERRFLKEDIELLEHLLLLNNNLDRVKIGFNRENMLFVRADLSVQNIDAQEFKDALDQVAASTDHVFKAIVPYILQ